MSAPDGFTFEDIIVEDVNGLKTFHPKSKFYALNSGAAYSIVNEESTTIYIASNIKSITRKRAQK